MELASMVTAGAGRAEIHFLHDEVSESAGRLAEQGSAWFGDAAMAPAVGALLTNDAPSVAIVLGAIATGARLVSLPLPPRGGDPLRYLDSLRDACRAHGIERVVARDDIVELLASFGITAAGHSAIGGEVLARPAEEGFELVQFSSGSTGRPKGIRLPADVLGTNLAAILEAVQPGEGDVAVSWLPLSHDMGLIGMLLTSLAACAHITPEPGRPRIVLMDPSRFVLRPAQWLGAIDHWRGTFTATPDFGLRVALGRRPKARVDLSSLDCVIVGGEIVRASTLERFEAAFVPEGLPPSALCPAYGMAEIGLAATMTRPADRWVAAEVDLGALSDGDWTPARPGAPSLRLVSSGRPLDGYGMSVVAPARHDVGAIELHVPCAGSDVSTRRPFADELGRVSTGDRGVVDGSALYVCGRSDDHIVAAGRNLYAPAIEDAASEVEGVRPGRVTVIDTPDGAWVVVAERQGHDLLGPTEERRLQDRVRRSVVAIAGAAPDEVALVAPGELPMTSSGKIQRHEVRSRWMVDRFHPSSAR